jgi:hypothetical protein
MNELEIFRTDSLGDLSDFQLGLRTAHLEQEIGVYPDVEQKDAAKVALEACTKILATKDIPPLDLSADKKRDASMKAKFGTLKLVNRKKSSK